jgi:zinc-ribbon domain
MIVCPNCRNSNPEDAEFCARCGRSLEPGPTPLVSGRREVEPEAVDELDVIAKPRKRWPVLVTAGVMLAVAGTAWIVVTSRPDPCDGTNFASERFGYCVTVPERWETVHASIGGIPVDEISLPTEAATIIILAVDLPQDQGLDAYAETVRERGTDAGLEPGPVRDLALDSQNAVQWDVTTNTESGPEFVMRQVVTVRNDVGWLISLSDSAETLHEHEGAFQSILSSWRFR